MNKRISRILSFGLVLMLCIAMAVPTFAFTYTELLVGETTANHTTTFEKYLVLDETANVPDVTFTFSIAAGAAIDADTAAGTLAVLPGPVKMEGNKVIAPSVGTAVFTYAGDNNDASKADEVDDSDTLEIDDNQVYVTKEITVDLSGVSFTEPGVYRYVITEDEYAGAGDDSAITVDGTRYLDVYVEDDETDAHNLKIAGYYLHTDAAAPDAESETTDFKSSGFKNVFTTFDLEVKKIVTGNQGSRDKYFMFQIDIENAVPGTYSVVYDPSATPENNYATSYDTITNPDTVSINEDGEGQLICYLQSNMTVTIVDLSSGATYTVTETPEDYEITSIVATGDTTDGVADTEAGTYTDAGIMADTNVTFTNDRSGVIPTGILLTIAPFAVLMIVGVIGAAVILRKKSHN